MTGRRFALVAALSLFVMFVSANLIANTLFRGWRIDLTENQLYSLSPGSKQVLDDLTEPLELTLYYSPDSAADIPQVQTYASRVREMLHSFAARSKGKLRFTEVNVAPVSVEEDQANEAGIEPMRLYEGADPIYLGLSGANAIDDTRVIPSFSPDREAFLEYEITRVIYELENPDRTHVALITSLPIDPAQAANPMFGPGQQSTFSTEMGRMMQVQTLTPDFTEIPADADVLVLIHPPSLTDVQLFAVDQFILRKGRAFIALDPAALSAQRNQNPYDPMAMIGGAATVSRLDPLLTRWGVRMSDDVVMDLDNALEVMARDETGNAVRTIQPLYFKTPATPDNLDREDLTTAYLNRGINFGLAGALAVSQREGLTATPLARTSGQTSRMPAAQALITPPPSEILRTWSPTAGRVETIALRLSGTLQSAFAEGPPPEAPPAADGSAPLTQSAAPAEIVIVADVDFLEDGFYIQQNGSIADNASFALNAIDILGGSDALVSLRARAPSLREMDLLKRMEADAQRMMERRQSELQTELQETEARLAQLQAGGRGSGFFTGDLGAELTADERAEIERAQTRVGEVRDQLRSIERDLRSNINQLEALVVFINVWLAPLLIAGAGLFLFWRRQRRSRRGAGR
jgi:ABC-2 type transport system permease protein